MGAPQVEHAQPRLSDTAADRERQTPFEQHPVELHLAPLGTSADRQLPFERLAVHADTHARQLEGVFENRVPDDDVAVEPLESPFGRSAPVVVVRGASVVTLAVRQLAADADEEQRAVFPCGGLLALLGRERGKLPQQLFGLDERDPFGQNGRDVRVEFVDLLFDGFHRLVDRFDDPFQEAEVALLGAHRALPVPLIDVERVDVVQLFVGADGVHVGVESVSRGDLVGSELHAFPLGQRVHHFGTAFAQVADRERHGAFHAVEVVVDARARKHEQRGRDAAQAQAAGQHVGKNLFEVGDGLLHRFGSEFGRVLFRNEQRHKFGFLGVCTRQIYEKVHAIAPAAHKKTHGLLRAFWMGRGFSMGLKRAIRLMRTVAPKSRFLSGPNRAAGACRPRRSGSLPRLPANGSRCSVRRAPPCGPRSWPGSKRRPAGRASRR